MLVSDINDIAWHVDWKQVKGSTLAADYLSCLTLLESMKQSLSSLLGFKIISDAFLVFVLHLACIHFTLKFI